MVVSAREALLTVKQKTRVRTRALEAYDQIHDQVVADRYAKWRHSPLEVGTVLYESFAGNGVLDNPEALFRHLLDQPDLAHLRHVWALADLDAHPEVTAEFRDHPRVRFVEVGSAAYFKALATAQYLVNNATFQPRFAKREGQVYINTWHGVPLKHMGVDMPDGAPESRNIIRNFLNADYILSANAYMTEVIYRQAYQLQGIYRGAIVEEGQPRMDRTVAALSDPAGTRALLAEHGLAVGDKRVVLYAPTWRGESFGSPWVNSAQLLATVRDLQAELGEDTAVLLKVHQVIYDAVRERVGDNDFLVPNSVPTNVVLAATDVLVTDYSSIFFDIVPAGRPVVHYVPDVEEYTSTRGMYLTREELSGPVCSSTPDLVAHVTAALDRVAPAAAVGDLHRAYDQPFDGRVCERVADLVFRGRPEEGYRVHRDFGTEKKTVLIYLGSMKSQGITTSALNLLRHIDYDAYDVTVFFPFSKGRDRFRNIRRVDPRVRMIPRMTVFAATRHRQREETKNLMVNGLPEQMPQEHVEFWTTEWQRMFGSARFEHLVDFSGYGCYAPFLYSVAETDHRSIWLHNDMYADMQRETDDRHLEDRLTAVFSTYRCFDSLVSVSRELNRVNRKKLAAYARPEQFTYAENTMDTERVLRLAGLTEADEGVHSVDAPKSADRGVLQLPRDNVARAVSQLLEHYDAKDVLREVRSRLRLGTVPTPPGTVTFVSVGRLSPEKNHVRLIRAFAEVHEKYPHTRLVILGGGDLEGRLNNLVLNLGLSMAVVVAGQVDNPYAIMREADCFVLSSDYEGQPMVILEARTLGLPIVTTAFSSVADSVPDDAGVVVPLSVEGVAKGMSLFLAGELRASTLDADAYNARAMQRFYDAISHRG